MNKPQETCLGDILWRFENQRGLKPNNDRIDAMTALYTESGNPILLEMLNDWGKGKIVLVNDVRLNALIKALNELCQNM